ncbi:neuraminidase-like domain-containing protein [Pseudomonas sp. P2757]|uniref:Tc toxin subunit A-related protein n=1 Tax=unclassified Pseudomonas TaxID=196821 RepID=UPI003B59FA8E
MPTSGRFSLKERHLRVMVDVVVAHQMAPALIAATTRQALSDRLLTDVEDTAQTQASELSATVRTLQRYIHGALTGLESGYANVHFNPDDRNYWWTILSNYSSWSANVLLKDHAANYIEPALRLNKTQLFRKMEGELMQRRLTDASVQNAVLTYIGSFEKLSNPEVLSSYIDGIANRAAPYYLVAKSRSQPFEYYLRKVKVEVDENSKTLNPAHWDEWEQCNINTAGKVIDIRCVIWLGQVALVWCEWIDRQVDGNGVVQSAWTLKIKLAFKSVDNIWSTARELHSQQFESDVSNGWLMAVSDGDGSPRNDRLRVFYTNHLSADGSGAPGGVEIHKVLDHLGREVEGDISISLLMALARFKNRNAVQQKVVPDDYPKVEIVPATPPDDTIGKSQSVDAVFSHEQLADGRMSDVLRIRGRCSAVEETARVLQRLSIKWQARHGLTSTDVSIQYAGDKQITISLTTRREPDKAHTVRLPKDKADYIVIKTIAIADFKETSTGSRVWEAQAGADLTDAAVQYLLARTAEEIRAGAGFSVDPLGDALVNHDNLVAQKIVYKAVPFSIGWTNASPEHPLPTTFTAPLDGNVATPWVTYPSAAYTADIPYPVDFIADGKTLTFNVTLKGRPKTYLTPTIGETNTQGAQFLSFNDSTQALKHLRLNSQIGAVLTSRAAISMDALLDWDTQHTPEHPLPDDTQERNGSFDSCNGRYLWEVFFHLPQLVSWRLAAEGRYQEAQKWLGYIFDPLAPAEVKRGGDRSLLARPRYWRCRPLKIEDLDCASEQLAPNDPDAIGYCAPIHFMIAIFLQYIQRLIEEGDDLFRRLDYDSMVRAGLVYSMALRMIGEQTATQTASTWTPKTLEQLLTATKGRNALRAFEAGLELSLADIPLSMTGQLHQDLTGSDVFKPGLNQRPAELSALLKSRLDHLRSNRTIEGHELTLPIFSRMGDPKELLIAQGNGTLGTSRGVGGQIQIVPYRFQTVFDLALAIVDYLAQLEDQLRNWLDMRDRHELEELMQKQAIELADYTRSIHQTRIEELESTIASLRQSEGMFNERVQHYERLVREGVSAGENRVIEKNRDARQIAKGAAALETVGAALRLIPTIFGPSFGGADPSAPVYTGARLLQMIAEEWRGEAEEAGINEAYRRRAEEWALEHRQSQAQVRVLREQVAAQEHAIRAARTSLEQADVANTQAKEIYRFYKGRATGPDLSNWVLGQLKSLLYQAYDLAFDQCKRAERSWQYEKGDFDARFIRHDTWNDTRHGFTCAAALKLSLFQMAAARIQSNERQIELTKTFSLKQYVPAANWDDFIRSGILKFDLTETAFAEDFPGLYCRQLFGITCTFPGLLGPYENLRATLTQISSSTMLTADINTFLYLHDGTGTAGSMVVNLRPHQQIGLSSGLNDTGVVDPVPSDRLMPFEGTGCHANYELKFARPGTPSQRAFLDSLTDIILKVDYRARSGGLLFEAAVEAVLVPPPPLPLKKRAADRAGKTPS